MEDSEKIKKMRTAKVNVKQICYLLLVLFLFDGATHISNALLNGSNVGRLFLLAMMLSISFFCRKERNVAVNRIYYPIFALVFLLFLGLVKTYVFDGDMGYAFLYITSGFVYLLYLPVLSFTIVDGDDVDKIAKFIALLGSALSVGSVVSLVTWLISQSLFWRVVTPLVKLNIINVIVPYGVTVRIMMSGIIFQVAALFIGLYLYAKYKFRYGIITIFLNIIGIVATYSRALIASTVFAGLIWLCLVGGHEQIVKKRIRLLFVLAVSLSIIALIYMLNGRYSGVLQVVIDRFMGVDNQAVYGSDIRNTMTNLVREKMQEFPILGGGLGSHIDYRDGTIEMTYHDVVIRMGMAGLTVLISPFLMIVLSLNRKSHIYEARVSYMCCLLATMIATYTNPYLITSVGLFVYCMSIRLYVLCSEKNRNYGSPDSNGIIGEDNA